jgi:CRISPR-associated protein Csx10
MIIRFYAYTLTLKAPLLLTALEGDPNSVRSLGLIPGVAVRGAVASKFDQAKDPQTFQTLILSEQVCYLNAYPLVDTVRSLPTPVPWRREKYSDQNHDLAGYSGRFVNDDDELESTWPQEQLQSLEAPFVTLDQPDLTAGVTSLESRVHQQRYRPKGRAYTDPVTNEARGTIFTYEALEANQEFRGIVAISGQNQVEIDTRLAQVKTALGEKVYLGRSRRARYGGEALVSAWSPVGVRGEREAEGRNGLIIGDLNAGQNFHVFLTADYIGRRSDTGQVDPTSFTTELINRLGGQVEVLRSRWAFRLVGGYNRTWGLQLPQVLTLRAGSVVVLKAQRPISYGNLLAIEQSGLGERRAEGFGRVLFLENRGTNVGTVNAPSPSFFDPPALPVPDLVHQMQQRILMDAVEQRITEVASGVAGSASSIPSPSLLGRLRVPLRSAATNSLDTFQQWLSGTDQQRLRRPAMKKLDACRINAEGRKALSDWLKLAARADSAAHLDSLLNFTRIAQKHYVESENAAKTRLLEQGTLLQIRVRLIDAVLALLTRRVRLEARRSDRANNE